MKEMTFSRLIITLFTLIIISSSLLFSVSGQTPPPPPLIYSAPELSDLNSFSAKGDLFEIDFSGSVTELQGYLAGRSRKEYIAKQNGSWQTVRVDTLLGPKESEKRLREYFLELKNEIENDGLELLTEKSIEHKGIKGKSFSFRSELTYTTGRLFIVGNRAYTILSKVTNWHILNRHYPVKVKQFQIETARLFHSFKLRRLTILGTSDSPGGVRSQRGISNQPKSSREVGGSRTALDRYEFKTRVFESEKGAFKAYFPVRPKKRVKKVRQSFGLSDYVIYSGGSRTGFYAVTYFDMPTVVTSSADRDLNIDIQKNVIIETTKAKLIGQKDIAYGGFLGKEFILTIDGNTSTVRMFFANQRLFRVMVATVGIDRKLSSVKRRGNVRIRKKFFDSFEVKDLPAPSAKPTEMPKSFGVRIEDSVFFTDYFGLSMNFPKGWRILTSEENESLKNVTNQIINDDDYKYPRAMKDSIDRTKILFVATDIDGAKGDIPPSVMVSVENSGSPKFDPKFSLRTISTIFFEKGDKVTVPVDGINIGGVEFAWVESFDKKDKVRQRTYLANLRNLAFQIYLTFETEEELKVLLNSLNSLKIEIVR